MGDPGDEGLQAVKMITQEKQVGSYASVVQKKHSLKKFEVNLTVVDGKPSVEIPDEIYDSSEPLWEDFLIGKFLETAPHVAKVHVIVNKIWNQGDKSQMIEVFEVNSTTMRFKIPNPHIRSRVLRRGMWNIAEVPLVVSKWSPMVEKTEQEQTSIPMWVFLKNVPMNMFSWDGLSFMTSPVGKPVRLHPETASCSRFDVAKIFVNVDLTKELPKSINFSKNGKDFLVDFIYPWLPTRCKLCEKWGHSEKKCLMSKRVVEEGVEEDVLAAKDNVVEKETRKSMEKEAETEVNSGSAQKRVIQVDAESNRVVETISSEEVEEVDIEEGQIIRNWSKVSPDKIGRGSASKSQTLSVEQEEMISSSRFSVLQNLM
ncbi:hypothetical protein Bca4012_025465 [Brassica carinata]|uniref:DUF4283 domain-containing protein n=1 Tax=Brassica carinata TaxID=52824 RepID=A0A8X7VGT3_BRACI|nr:hypothetical protein Bca52824_022524 [Brassica carinata]